MHVIDASDPHARDILLLTLKWDAELKAQADKSRQRRAAERALADRNREKIIPPMSRDTAEQLLAQYMKKKPVVVERRRLIRQA